MPKGEKGFSVRGRMRRNYYQEPIPDRPIPLELDAEEVPVFDEGMCREALVLAMFGYGDADIAKWFGVDTKRLNLWKKDYPEFQKSIEQAEAMLHGEALTTIRTWAVNGYHMEEMFMEKNSETGEYEPGDKVKVRKMPPSLDAAKFLAEATAPGRYGRMAGLVDGQTVALTGEVLKNTINQIVSRIPKVVEAPKKPLPPKKVKHE